MTRFERDMVVLSDMADLLERKHPNKCKTAVSEIRCQIDHAMLESSVKRSRVEHLPCSKTPPRRDWKGFGKLALSISLTFACGILIALALAYAIPEEMEYNAKIQAVQELTYNAEYGDRTSLLHRHGSEAPASGPKL